MDHSEPIGFFDSGVGGLSVWQSINKLLPMESTIYLADSLNAPYGEKSMEEIIQFSVKNTELLLKHNVKLIVVACNTATTNAISHLRASYPIEFIGIEPATKPAAIATLSGKIGILATKGTLASELFLNTSKQYRGSIEIIETVGTGLVQIVESGELDKAQTLLESYLAPMIAAGVDNIVLGCTHYPFLKPLIEKLLPSTITIVDSGEPVAKHTQRILAERSILSESKQSGHHEFITNGNLNVLSRFVELVQAKNCTLKKLSF